MGAEREDTDPASGKTGTEPGLGPGSGQKAASAEPAPPPVDFDALHAALGDPMDLEELPPAAHEVERGDGRRGDSSGRPSATYASSRPHTIPPTRAPAEDLNAPAVIVASEALDTVPSAPPNMTMPVNAHRGPPPPHGAPIGPPPSSSPSGPHATAVPSSGPHAATGPSASYPFTPQPFAVQRHMAQMTVRMPDRPLPRRPKTPTIVVRQRGPSAAQKIGAFVAMLLLFTACGIAVVIWQRPSWVGLAPAAPALTTATSPTSTSTPAHASTPSPTNATTSAAAPPTGAASTAPPGPATTTAASASPPPASVKRPSKPPPPPPPRRPE